MAEMKEGYLVTEDLVKRFPQSGEAQLARDRLVGWGADRQIQHQRSLGQRLRAAGQAGR